MRKYVQSELQCFRSASTQNKQHERPGILENGALGYLAFALQARYLTYLGSRVGFIRCQLHERSVTQKHANTARSTSHFLVEISSVLWPQQKGVSNTPLFFCIFAHVFGPVAPIFVHCPTHTHEKGTSARCIVTNP